MVILLDEDSEGVEKNQFALSDSLLAAIQEKQLCLVSSSLWISFLERRNEFERGCKIPETDEYKVINYITSIRNEIKTLSDIMNNQSADEIIRNRHLVVDIVNQKFLTPHALDEQKNALPTPSSWNHIKDFLPYYLVPFDPQEWDIYAVSNDFKLLVPHEYTANNTSSDTENNALSPHTPYTKREIELGIKVDHLPKDTFSTSTIDVYLNHYKNKKSSGFLRALKTIFVNIEEGSSCTWYITLMGHGYNNIAENKSSLISIATLTILEFKDFLHFLEHSIKTKLLFYTSCYAGGTHLVTPYTTDNNPDVYSYAIITNCLSDASCASSLPLCAYTAKKTPSLLTIDDILWNEGPEQYTIKITPAWSYKEFFHTLSSSTEEVTQNPEVMRSIIDAFHYKDFSNIPWMRLPGKHYFMPLYPNNSLKLDPLSVLAYSMYHESITVTDNKNMIMVDTPYASLPLILHKPRIETIVSVAAGNTIHLFESIDASAQTLDDCVKMFWPLDGLSFTKIYLIKKLSILSKQKEKITLFNVIISTKNDRIMRMLYGDENGKSFSAYARALHGRHPDELRVINSLDENECTLYKEQWALLENQAMAQYNAIEPTLDNLTCAMTHEE